MFQSTKAGRPNSLSAYKYLAYLEHARLLNCDELLVISKISRGSIKKDMLFSRAQCNAYKQILLEPL